MHRMRLLGCGFAAFKQHRFVNRGFLNGPICPIYGVGVTLVIACLEAFQSNLLLLYISSVILVTVLEGVTGWAMDKLFHNKWWDYSKLPFNIGGYVCLLFSLIWGVACVFIVYFVHPLIHQPACNASWRGAKSSSPSTGRVRNSLLPGLSIALMAIRYIRALLLLFTTRLLTKSVSDGSENVRLPTEIACVKGSGYL